MSLSDFPLFQPTIKMDKPGNYMYGVYGHIVSLLGGFFMTVSGFFNLFNSQFLSLIGLIGGIFILIIEFDQYDIPFLKDPLNRGLIWMVLGSISNVHWLAIILIFVGGAFYLVYHYQ